MKLVSLRREREKVTNSNKYLRSYLMHKIDEQNTQKFKLKKSLSAKLSQQINLI